MSAQARRIHLMSPLLANQIAAGEVVERPSSVLKELLENCLDAGARDIEIDVEGGGGTLIRVRDDGCGIHPEDLVLATNRHATSKLTEARDLERITSLGFRGEALASIASVSRLRLISRCQGQAHGWLTEVTAAQPTAQSEPASHPLGTTVEVRELFFNTPARRKFMRSERTEFNHLLEVVKRIALSRFDTAIVLRHNQRQVLRLKPVDATVDEDRRLAGIVGQSFLQQSLRFEYAATGLRLWGWLGVPGYGRAQADLQYSFINGRMVRDKVINHAIRQATAELVPPGRYAAYVLYLALDEAEVDVNVHPTKHEVRFHEGRLVHDFIVQSLNKALRLNPGVAAGEGDVAAGASNYTLAASLGTSSGMSGPRRIPGRAASWVSIAETRSSYAGPSLAELIKEVPAAQTRRFLDQLDERYLLVRDGAQLVIIDRARAQAAIARKRLGQAYDNGEYCAQPLLVPFSRPVDKAIAERLEGVKPTLFRLGFEIDRMAEERVILRQIPIYLQAANLDLLLESALELIPALSGVGSGAGGVDNLLAALCPAGLWDQGGLNGAECEALLASLDSLGLMAAGIVDGQGLVLRLDGEAIAALLSGVQPIADRQT